MEKTTRSHIKKRQESDNKFLKKTVIFCIGFIVLFTGICLWFNHSAQTEVSPTLTTCVFAFFGTELASTAFIRIMDNRKHKEERKEQLEDEERHNKQNNMPPNENPPH